MAATKAKARKPYQHPGLDNTAPSISRCKCGALVLDAMVDGWHSQVAPLALSLDGQAEAAEAGLDLFELHLAKFGRTAELISRDESRIRADRPHIGLASHDCQIRPEDFAPEWLDPAGQGRVEAWLLPGKPATTAFEPPF